MRCRKGRQFPTHPWQKVFEAVFLGAAMQIPSLLQIEAECCRGVLAKRLGPISDDTIGYALQRQSPEPAFALGCDIARRLKRNGVLRSDWSRLNRGGRGWHRNLQFLCALLRRLHATRGAA